MMDKSTFLRRTPAGDAEVRAPASGLSVTQRRILTLLDTPRRVRDLPVGPMVNTERITRDAARLNRAGLVVYERGTIDALQAANAGSLTPAPQPIARRLYLLLGVAAVGVLVWAQWRFQTAPAPSADARAHSGTPSVAIPPAAIVTPDPPVIATRVLRGDPTKEARAKGSSAVPEGAGSALPPPAKGTPTAPAPSTASRIDSPSDPHGIAPDP